METILLRPKITVTKGVYFHLVLVKWDISPVSQPENYR